MSRTRGASRTGRASLRPCAVTSSSTGERLERDDPVAERATRCLVRDLLALRGAHQRRAERRRCRDRPGAGGLLLGVTGEEVRLVLVLLVERLEGDEHARSDLLGTDRS